MAQRFKLRSSWLALPPLLAACHTPAPEPLEPHAVATSLAERPRSLAVELERSAPAIAGLVPLGLRPPRPTNGWDDPNRDAFWHACALAYEPALRQARAEAAAHRAAIDSLDRPDDLGAALRASDFGAPGAAATLELTFELLSLLDVVHRPARTSAAEAAWASAQAQLEAHCWRAVFAVDRARVRVAAARGRRERLTAFAREALRDLERVLLLERVGRLPAFQVSRARAMLANVERAVRDLEADEADARAALARAAGLAPDDLPAGADPAELLERVERRALPTPRAAAELVLHHPALRAGARAYAVAEARLRLRIAERWPTLRLGPELALADDPFLAGGSLALALPFPGSREGFVRAAVEERAAARFALEDALLAQRTRLASRAAAWEAARARLDDAAPTAETAGAHSWDAARTALRFADGVDDVERWIEALQLRAATVFARVDALEELWLAELDLRADGALAPGLEESP